MTIECDTITGPAFLASALVNGDKSGLSDADEACLARFEERIAPWYVVSTVDEQEPWFTWSFRLHGGDASGGDVIDYVIHKESGK